MLCLINGGVVLELRNKEILIFGGGSGIGKAIAIKLLSERAKVVIAGRDLEKLKRVKEELCDDNLFFMRADIADVSKHEEYFNNAEQLMGGLSGFVNSAGVSTENIGRGYEPWDITEEEWDYFSSINFKGAYFIMRNEINYLKEKGVRGNILNISSNAPCMDVVGLYGASKQAVIRWTRALGKKYGRYGININGVAPGITFTPFISDYAKDINEEFPRHAIGRIIRPEEIAETVFYLMTKEAEIVCGHTIIADGGDSVAVL